MATTTTNFGWDIPQSTDLVKDGATAIAALGQDIDTALVDLKGGTTGQVLAKASNTDLDYSWVTQDDANAIQNAQLTAKGALISAFSAGSPATLTVGSNDQVLTADSTTATGLKWAASSSGALVYVGGASFTTSSFQSFNNVFTSTYQNYMVVVNTEQSGLVTSNFRLRVSGADNTTSNYYSTASYNQIDAAGGDTDVKASATTTWATNNTGGLNQVYYIHSPQSTLKTFLSSNQIGFIYTPNFYTGRVSGLFNATTSFDGFTFFPGSGTMTGNIRIYGIANS
jgi:hypothetical protein